MIISAIGTSIAQDSFFWGRREAKNYAAGIACNKIYAESIYTKDKSGFT